MRIAGAIVDDGFLLNAFLGDCQRELNISSWIGRRCEHANFKRVQTFARTFAQLIRSGVPILEVLDIVGGTAGNYVIEKSIKSVSENVEKGDNLSVALSKKPIFPPMLLRMVAAGEATGKIDTMLEKMADFWDEEIEAMLDALTSLIEPLLIVFLGLVVGGIVISMFLPIFKLNEVVSQTKQS